MELVPGGPQDSHLIVHASGADAVALIGAGSGEEPAGTLVEYLALAQAVVGIAIRWQAVVAPLNIARANTNPAVRGGVQRVAGRQHQPVVALLADDAPVVALHHAVVLHLERNVA